MFLRKGAVTRPIVRRLFRNSKEAHKKVTGLFGDAKLKTPKDILALPKQVRATTKRLLEELNEKENGDGRRTAVQIIDDMSNEICKAADLAECVRQMHDDKSFRAAAEDACRDYCDLVESLNTNTTLYTRLKSSLDTQKERLDDVDRRTIGLFLDDFEQAGVHLPQDKKDKYVDINGEIFDACAQFQSKCDQEVAVKKSEQAQYGLKSSRLHSSMSTSIDPAHRKFVYNSYFQYFPKQEEQLRRIVGSRHALAKLTGFESFAHRAQRNTLLKDFDAVHDFLICVIEDNRASAEREIAVLMDIQAQCEPASNGPTAGIAEWDLPYLMNIYRESAFDVAKRMREVAPFFTLSSLLAGFSKLTQKLYGIRLVERDIQVGELWNAMSIIKLEAVDEQNNELGTIYIDVSMRPEKSHGDCHHTVLCSKLLADGGWQSPIVVLALSMQDPTQQMPWQRVTVRLPAAEVLFHELGHAMHSVLGRTRYQHVAGTRCPQDFSEIPSNLMEYFFNDMTVLRQLLRDGGDDAATLSVDAAASLLAARSSFTAVETVQQAAYGLYDLVMHGPELAPMIADGTKTSAELFHSIMRAALPMIHRHPQSAYNHRFVHTVHYGARYYSYLVARAAASLIWQKRFRDDPFSRKWGDCWAEVQSHGGGHPPGVLLKKILDVEPCGDVLTAALVNESEHLSNLDAVTV